MSVGVRPEERFVDEEEAEVKGEGDDRHDSTVVALIKPLDAPIDIRVVVVVN